MGCRSVSGVLKTSVIYRPRPNANIKMLGYITNICTVFVCYSCTLFFFSHIFYIFNYFLYRSSLSALEMKCNAQVRKYAWRVQVADDDVNERKKFFTCDLSLWFVDRLLFRERKYIRELRATYSGRDSIPLKFLRS